MDRERFDELARLLHAEGTRRAAFAAVLGSVFLAGGLDVEAKRRKKKKKKPFDPATCFGDTACAFQGPGKDYDDCDWVGTGGLLTGGDLSGSGFRRGDFAGVVLDGANMQGAKFLNANFREASAVDVDIQGAGFNGACLMDADFTGAIFAGPVFAQALLCRTTLPDGSIDSRDCGTTNPCCQDVP